MSDAGEDPDCLGMCAVDGDVCTGCGRTLDQINTARGGSDDEDGAGDAQNEPPAPAAGRNEGVE